MCGIGIIHSPHRSASEREAIATKMHESIAHRGPNSFGVWSDENGLSIFHRRLAILDLSPSGAQPMISAGRRWILSFNGEIYNHAQLKKLLAGQNLVWNGTSDTEVLLHLIELYGPEEAITRCQGMFAIILWDQQEKALYLSRDRIGEKPLYYGKVGRDVVVGSELKIFLVHPEFNRELDELAISAFFKYNYVPTPLSIFKGIRKLKPAHIYKFNFLDFENPEVREYWTIPHYQQQLRSSASPTFESAKLEIKNRLSAAVKQQMQADVPLGVFLSGGVDSSLICALMTKLGSKRIDTFTIGFENENYDESRHAKRIAEHLGTRHFELIVSAKDCLSAIEKIPQVYDEPFADSSQVPTYLLAKMTCQHVSVALSGDGGDELFAGYNRYAWAGTAWDTINRIPSFLRMPISQFAMNLNAEYLNQSNARLARALGKPKKFENLGSKLVKCLSLANASSLLELHDRLLCHWFDLDQLLLRPANFSLQSKDQIKRSDFEAYMMWHDQHHYLPDDIMVKVDRASMANSLETRAPFLDHRLIDYVASMPVDLVRNVRSPKKLIREILYEYVPRQLFERPKMGFGIPIYDWLKTDLKELTLDLLAEPYLKNQGIFNSHIVSKFAHLQLNKNLSHPHHLWTLLMFQLWHRTWAN